MVNNDTVCTGSCTVLGAQVSGPAGTSNYATLPVPYAPYPFTGGNPVLVNLDDLWSPVINIPFCFEFYGNVYNQLIVGTNGLVSFDVSQANGACPWTISAPIPNPALPMNCIMAPFHDINPMLPTSAGNTQISWQVVGSAPCRSFVISWNDVAMFGTGCDTTSSTMQVVLHEVTYIIDIFIANKPFCPTWNNGYAIEGLHNPTGTAAVVIPGRNFPAQWSATADGVRFRPAGPVNATYQWLDPSNTVVGTSLLYSACPTQTTTYTLNVTFTMCSGPPVTLSGQVTLYVIPSVVTATPVVTQPTCTGICDGAISIVVTSGQPPFVYSWAPAMQPVATQTNLCPGQYQCTVIDAFGCLINFPITLTPVIQFTASTSSTPSLCNSPTGTATGIANGGTGPYTYQWNTGDTTSVITNISGGSYVLIVTDANGCCDTLNVAVNTAGLQLTHTVTTLVCATDSNATATVAAVSGTGPFTYLWAPSGATQATVTGLPAGTTTVMVTDSTGCIGMQVINVNAPPPILVSPSSNTTICFGESVTISASVTGGVAPYTYVWSHNLPSQPSNVITPGQTDTYTLYIIDGNGCTSPVYSTQVKVTPLPVADFYSLEPGCPPALVPFYNTTDTAVTFIWDFGDPSSGANNTSLLKDPAHIYASSGNYNVTLIAINVWGCADTITHPVGAVPLAPTAAVAVTQAVVTTVDPQTSYINNSSGGSSYCIYFGDGDSLCTSMMGPYPHTYDSVGVYTVMLVTWNQLGCTDTAWVTVSVEEPTTCYIPNAFTPDGSGLNDVFMVYGMNIDDFELRIYDRWGMLIFTSNSIYNGWDGTFKGDKCQEDVYVWKLTYRNNFGERKMKYGHVSLIR